MTASIVDLSLQHLERCLRVDNAPEVVTALQQAMPGWPMTVQAAHGASPATYIYRDAEGLWQGSFNELNEFTLPSAASAACSLVGELISQRLKADHTILGLHCGSVEINGQLAVFPQSSRAGKSTLTVAFAAAGYRVFGDDVLGLTAQGEGRAMGVAPRLRLPLPETFSTEFVTYSERYAGPEDERYRFVVPPATGLARYQETCPIGTIVLLERGPHILEAEVVALAPGEALLQLLCQNFAASDTPNEVLLERLLPLVAQVSCVLLRYNEPLAGARHLAQVLQGVQSEQPPLLQPASALQCAPADIVTPAASVLSNIWMPAAQVSVYPVGDELFLIQTQTGAIHRLNTSGALAWQLLQHEPLSAEAISEVLAMHFSMPKATLKADIQQLLAALMHAELIVKATLP